MTPTAPRPYSLCAVPGPAVQGADVVQRLREFARDYTTTSFHDDLINEGIDEIERLRAQVAELEKDAKRYRWLRNQPRKLPAGQSGIMACKWEADGTGFDLVKSELDAAIDAARKE